MRVSLLLKKIIFSLLLFYFLFFNFSNPTYAVKINNQELLFDKALGESKDGNFFDALETWNQFIKISPRDPAALSNRGNVRLALGDAKGSIIDQTHSIEIEPNDFDPYLNRGIAYESLGNWEEALLDYKWILDKDPDNSAALYNLANVMGSQGDWLAAEKLFKHASLSRTGFALASSSKSLALYQNGKLEEAESELRKIIRKYPMFADARSALSALLWRKGYFGEAESNWVAASGLDNRYRDRDWLLNIRRWPPKPTDDLMAFLALETP